MLNAVVVALIALNSWADVSNQFQTTAGDQEFLSKVQTLDLNCAGCTFKYKDTGTSVGMKIKINGEKGGKFVPPCSATNIEAQVVAYQLGRFLGMSNIVMPSAYYTLKGRALGEFKAMLNRASERNRWRLENRNKTLAAINGPSSAGLLGVYTAALDGGSPEVKGLAKPEANTINSAHPIAKFIKANGPVPSPGRMMTLQLAGVSNVPAESELELARQFSKIMVLDMLAGEWDRWSGGNVEATIEDGKVFLLSRDNGGASMRGVAHMAKYKGIVTRFDREQIGRVRVLVQLLEDSSAGPELVKALQIRSANHSLLVRAKDILEHVKRQSAAHGEKAFF